MENKFYTDDFEQFLKETADDFRMYPSKRVWNSLYNNLHPGRKWPSLAVCLLLVSSIIFIGLAHKNEITGSKILASKDKLDTNTLIAHEPIIKSNTEAMTPVKNAATDKVETLHDIVTSGIRSSAVAPPSNRNMQVLAGPSAELIHLVNNDITKVIKETDAGSTKNRTRSGNRQSTRVLLRVTTPDPANSTAMGVNNKKPFSENSGQPEAFLNKSVAVIEPRNGIKSMPALITPLLRPAANIPGNNKEKEWMEDYAFHNKPASSLKSKMVYQLYITPSAGFRTLRKNVSYSIPARPSLIASSPEEEPNVLVQNSALNLEAGYNFIYPYSKSIRIKGGLQLNYTNYRVYAHELGHSSITTLLLNDPYSGGVELSQRSSSLANLSIKGGDNKLNNSTFQVSLPIGADLKLAGKNKLQWFAGATVQPTYVLFGNAYLVSSDMKNYVYDADLLRKWNLNAAVETFISYKTKKGVSFSAGPQLRYQLFSTYSKSYSYDEKLYNFGIKLGMTRNF
ncbi:MAG: hypothetical protein H7258_14490 [Ferruginibacter sp.]|nr:hypothetical protein [Ferruginibacter sp.]